MNQFAQRVFLTFFMGYSVFLAHALGGSVPKISNALVASLVIFFITYKEVEIGGPKLAATLLGFQIIGHLSMPASISTSAMKYSHIIAAIVTYQLITKFEHLISKVKEWLLPLEFVNYTVVIIWQVVADSSKQLFLGFLRNYYFDLRAPPINGGNM
jgi:hypothetical protein